MKVSTRYGSQVTVLTDGRDTTTHGTPRHGVCGHPLRGFVR